MYERFKDRTMVFLNIVEVGMYNFLGVNEHFLPKDAINIIQTKGCYPFKP